MGMPCACATEGSFLLFPGLETNDQDQLNAQGAKQTTTSSSTCALSYGTAATLNFLS